jgi:hypothetical protein
VACISRGVNNVSKGQIDCIFSGANLCKSVMIVTILSDTHLNETAFKERVQLQWTVTGRGLMVGK